MPAVVAGYCVMTACKPVPSGTAPGRPAADAAPATATATYDPSASPSRKEIIRVLLKNGRIPLSGEPSCSGVGTEPKDVDLIEYLSGFLAEQDRPDGGNWIEATASPAQGKDGERRWHSELVIRHAQGDDVWGWGVSYEMRGSDHSVVEGSVHCTGSG
jgi:hypothetical protein